MRHRLGEILIEEGLITSDQLEGALRAQVIYGGRVGTNLVELGALDVEQLSHALAKQYGVPAASQKDFDNVKPSTLALLPPKLVEKHSALPLDVSDRNPKTLAVAFIDPSKVEAIDEISFVTGMRVKPRVSAELRMFFYLEKLCGVRRRTRFIRVEEESAAAASSGATETSGTADSIPTTLAVEIEVPLHHLKGGPSPPPRRGQPEIRVTAPARVSPSRSAPPRAVPPAPQKIPPAPQKAPPAPQRMLIAPQKAPPVPQRAPPAPEKTPPAPRETRLPADLDAFLSGVNAESELAGDEVTAVELETVLELLPADEEPVESPAIPDGPSLSLAEAVAKISSCSSRHSIADAIVDCLKSNFICSIIFTVRHGVAFGWKAHGIADAEALAGLAIPLNLPSFLKVAHDHRSAFRGPPPMDGATVHTGLWQMLRMNEPSEVLIAPIVLRDRVVSLIVAVPGSREAVSDEAMSTLTTLAFSASTSFVRLIQRAKTAA